MTAPVEFHADEIAAALAAAGRELSQEQIEAIAAYLQKVGSLEDAQQAIEALGRLKAAA